MGLEVRTPMIRLASQTLSELEMTFFKTSTNCSSATWASTFSRKPPWMSRCAAIIFRNRDLNCFCTLAWSGSVSSRFTTSGKGRFKSSRSIPGKVASGRSFKLMSEYSRLPILRWSSASSSTLTLAAWLRALSYMSCFSGGIRGTVSWDRGLSARLISRNSS